MASLLVISGSTAGDYYLLGQDPVVIGRDDGSPIQIVDEAVSRRHLRISPDGDGSYAAEDLASANGTYVNDIRIGEAWPTATSYVSDRRNSCSARSTSPTAKRRSSTTGSTANARRAQWWGGSSQLSVVSCQ